MYLLSLIRPRWGKEEMNVFEYDEDGETISELPRPKGARFAVSFIKVLKARHRVLRLN